MPNRDYCFWVYILASRSRNLYIGMTNNLTARVLKHRSVVPGTHTAKYNIWRLVYVERHQYVRNAIRRETELKRWTREFKVQLIEKVNPTWRDLAEDYPLMSAAGLEQADSPEGNDKKKSNDNDPAA
jgi:putative endonuclease